MGFDYIAAPKEAVRGCNLCGLDQFEDFAEQDRYGLPVKSVRCRGCGLVFLNPRMTAGAYRQFYGNGVYRELLAKYYSKSKLPAIDECQMLSAHWLDYWLRPHMEGRSGTLLDIGGSVGVVAETFCKRYPFKAVVLEPSVDEAAQAASRGHVVHTATIEEWEPEGRQFDAVILFQSVDHLMDITGALRKIRSMLVPGGLFFVDISDYRQILYYEPKREKVIKVDHPFYLTPELMRCYLERARFRVVDQVGGRLQYQQAFICEAR